MAIPGVDGYIQARGDGGPRGQTQYVIIHATDNASATARNEADYAARRTDGTSAHFYVDDVYCYQALNLGHIAYGALYNGNARSVQFELCGRSNQIKDTTMRRAAPVVAAVCRAYGIPVRKLGYSDIRNGLKGICGHGDVTAAYPQDGGDHTDPGDSFPWARFIQYVAEGGGDEFMGILDPGTPENKWASDVQGGVTLVAGTPMQKVLSVLQVAAQDRIPAIERELAAQREMLTQILDRLPES